MLIWWPDKWGLTSSELTKAANIWSNLPLRSNAGPKMPVYRDAWHVRGGGVLQGCYLYPQLNPDAWHIPYRGSHAPGNSTDLCSWIPDGADQHPGYWSRGYPGWLPPWASFLLCIAVHWDNTHLFFFMSNQWIVTFLTNSGISRHF